MEVVGELAGDDDDDDATMTEASSVFKDASAFRRSRDLDFTGCGVD